MNGRADIWEKVGAASAMGGTAVWACALAARVGVWRAVLQVFPRFTWDGVTWLLIPAVFLLPPVLQGVGVALASDVRPAPWRPAIWGAVGGTLLAALTLEIGFVIGRPVIQATLGLVPILSEFTSVCFGIVMVAGWLVLAARIPALAGLRAAALPVALPAVTLAWALAHGRAASVVNVLDQHEIIGLFAAVALGGAVGSVWSVLHPTAVRPLLRVIRGGADWLRIPEER